MLNLTRFPPQALLGLTDPFDRQDQSPPRDLDNALRQLGIIDQTGHCQSANHVGQHADRERNLIAILCRASCRAYKGDKLLYGSLESLADCLIIQAPLRSLPGVQ